MTEWLKRSKWGLAVVALVPALLAGLAALSGCSFADWVSVDVPREVQKGQGVPASIPLSEAEQVFEDHVRAGERFASEIEDGFTRLGYLEAMLSTALSVGGQAIPGGALATTGLALLGGILIKGPGTATAEKKSYNKGKAEAERHSKEMLEAAARFNLLNPSNTA